MNASGEILRILLPVVEGERVGTAGNFYLYYHPFWMRMHEKGTPPIEFFFAVQ
jgi:hypothetical protein